MDRGGWVIVNFGPKHLPLTKFNVIWIHPNDEEYRRWCAGEITNSQRTPHFKVMEQAFLMAEKCNGQQWWIDEQNRLVEFEKSGKWVEGEE